MTDKEVDPGRECNILDRTGLVCPRHGHSHEYDILERLRYWEGDGEPHGQLHRAARFEIERLRSASGTEAQRAETPSGSVHDGPTAESGTPVTRPVAPGTGEK